MCFFYYICLHPSFWPGSFFYIVTVLPAIWVAELRILNEKIKDGADNCERNAETNYYQVGGGLVCSQHSIIAGGSNSYIESSFDVTTYRVCMRNLLILV